MVIIRSAEESDLNSLSKLAELCFIDTFGHLYSKENLLTHLKTTCSQKYFSEALSNDLILVAEDAGKLLGYIKFGEVGLPIEPLPKNSKEIHRLYVHPNFKERGIGTRLMEAALKNPAIKGANNYYLSVYEDNIEAQKFYKSYGFSIVGEYDYYVGSHIDREFIMHSKKPCKKL